MFSINFNMYSSIMEIKKIIFWVLALYLAAILLASCRTPEKVEPKKCCDKEVKTMGLEKEDKWSKYEYLDNDPNVVYWEIMEDGVHIYTKEDSLRDERERWRYIDSLYKAEELLYN